ncbi:MULTISPECIES: hypothetical protein [Gracilibacillus]|uniref:hypothetical protein n=1 Tax=Gracilibacillus TaxID=74385 RepID=UPI0008256EEA|nr:MULTISPECIES: hypothetical protein [Gracilibacillus]
MEEKIENNIDNALGVIAPQLTIFSMIIGMVLIVLGMIFCLKKSSKKHLKTTWILCIGIGILAIISNLMQL